MLSPSGHITRYDLVVEESIGESSRQFSIQWMFYLVLVSTAVQVNGPGAYTKIKFDSLILSSTLSTISLSRGMLKVLLL